MAKIPHRISFDLLADDVKSILTSSFTVFDVTYDYVFENLNPYVYQYVKVTNGENQNKIYMWSEEGFKFIGEYEHTHTKSQITDFVHNHDTEYYTKQQIVDQHYTKTEIDNKLYTKADKEVRIGTIPPNDNNMWYKEI